MYSKLKKYTGNNYNILNEIRDTTQNYDNYIISSMKYGIKHIDTIYPYFKKFIQFLEKHNVLYFLVGGSLLGCIRTGKSIAWDDDFDIYISTTEMQKLLNMSVQQENPMEYSMYNYKFVKNKSGFYKLYESGQFVTDIFNEKDNWYKNSVNPLGPPIRKQFHDMVCNVGKNYHDELTFYYGERYLTEYVLCNHKINNIYAYFKKDQYKYIQLDKLDYEKYLKYI